MQKYFWASVVCAVLAMGILSSCHKSPENAWTGKRVTTDVLVVGGTPSGVAAALAAARQGAKVLLVEPHDELGGDITYAMLNMFDVPMNANGTSDAATGIFGEFYDKLGVAFDIDAARALFVEKVAAEPNITLWKRTRLAQIWKKGNRVRGAVVEAMPGKTNSALPAAQVGIEARVIVDATNDADVAVRAGAAYYVGREAGGFDKRQQSVSLLFSVSGANWAIMKSYVQGNRAMPAANRIGQEYASDVAPTTSREVAPQTIKETPQKKVMHRLGGVDGNYIWERGDVVAGYVPANPDVMAMSINFGRQSDGTVVLNTLNAVGVNGLSPADKERGRRSMIAELPRFIAYLRHAMPGLENIQLATVAPELYIRETRHLRGLVELQVDDVRDGRKFPDRIAWASYPLDLHLYLKGETNPFAPTRYQYSIPLGSLVPQKIDGLFVASRCLGASYEAAGSARVIPITMAVGQATGVAAALAISNHWTPHQIAGSAAYYGQVQEQLRKSGANIGDNLPALAPSSVGEIP